MCIASGMLLYKQVWERNWPPKTASTWLAIKKKKGSCKSLSRASSVVNATGHQAPPRHLESSVSTVSDGSAPHANKGKRKDAPKPCSQRGMSIVSGMFVALYKRCLAGKCQNPRLPGRSIMTGHLHICLLDIPSACGLLSTWQAQCQKHLWQLGWCLVGGCVLKNTWRERCGRPSRYAFAWHTVSLCSSFCLVGAMSETFLTVGAVFGGCGCVFKTAWQEHRCKLPRYSFAWHALSVCFSFCLAGSMPETCLTEPHEHWRGAFEINRKRYEQCHYASIGFLE